MWRLWGKIRCWGRIKSNKIKGKRTKQRSAQPIETTFEVNIVEVKSFQFRTFALITQ